MIDEKKLSIADQMMLGIFRAKAGNRLDGDIAFTYAHSPFGNWAPPEPEQSCSEGSGGSSDTSRELARFHYEEPTIGRRISNLLLYGLVYGPTFGIVAIIITFFFTRKDIIGIYVFLATVACYAIYGLLKWNKIDQYGGDHS